MCVCVCVYVYVCTHVCTHVCGHMCTHVRMHVRTHVHLPVPQPVPVYACAYACVCVCVPGGRVPVEVQEHLIPRVLADVEPTAWDERRGESRQIGLEPRRAAAKAAQVRVVARLI